MAALDWSECSAVESVPRQGQSLMRVLFDNGTPGGVAAALSDHIVELVHVAGTLLNRTWYSARLDGDS
jgi:hypothetical protein